ncbi:unnamed protein product [Cuscuta epithymum]|uniref:Protein WUSCHEL n=1 Tax=Cuscuta epithymum TaxID=186058 RepID=A0AAV0EM58_9ASTE|nr:unnamed protein product [Cuscuta epithymum]
MTPSNKNWPSMFKAKGGSKKGNTNQWMASDKNSSRASSSSSGKFEERTPELKERWNPRPEQIRILEAVFNSGIVTPMREDIVRIRTRIEEYGKVADSSVFYWFQNRKSRSKNKQRKLRSAEAPQPPPPPQRNLTLPPPTTLVTPTVTILSSSSSSSSSSNSGTNFNNNINTNASISNGSSFYQTPMNSEFHTEPPPPPPPLLYPSMPLPVGTASASENFDQGFCFKEAGEDVSQASYSDLLTIGNSSAGLMPTFVNNDLALNINPNQHFAPSFAPPFQGEMKATVIVNDMAYEVPTGIFNIPETFGDGAVLLHYPSGQPVVTNEWGFTLDLLEPGAIYYLFRTSS